MLTARIGRTYFSGYADIALPVKGATCPGPACDGCKKYPCIGFGLASEHAMAKNTIRARRGDYVEIRPGQGTGVGMKIRPVWIIPILAFIVGGLIEYLKGKEPLEIALGAAMVGILAALIVWIFTRGSRLTLAYTYEVVGIIRSDSPLKRKKIKKKKLKDFLGRPKKMF